MRVIPHVLLGVLPALSFANLAVAADDAKANMATPPVMLGQVAMGLLFVVGVILLLAWILKKLGPAGAFHSRSMKILAALPLGAREKAVVIQVGDKQIMLGIAPGRVNCLHVFDEPVITPPENSGDVTGTDFTSKFKEILSQKMGRS